jgi:poly(A) polymerase Pap1
LKGEFARGKDITAQIEKDRGNVVPLLKTLFEPKPFFLEHKNYICVTVWANSEDDLNMWSGWTEARMRFSLCRPMAYLPGTSVRPWPFSQKEADKPLQDNFFIGLNVDKNELKTSHNVTGQKVVELSAITKSFMTSIRDDFKIDGEPRKEGMEIKIVAYKASQLPDFVFGDDIRRPPKHPNFKGKKKRRKKKRKQPTGSQTQPAAAAAVKEASPPVPGSWAAIAAGNPAKKAKLNTPADTTTSK